MITIKITTPYEVIRFSNKSKEDLQKFKQNLDYYLTNNINGFFEYDSYLFTKTILNNSLISFY